MPLDPSPSRAGPPDAEALRQAALRASWVRDRRVGRRRVAVRWIAWAFWRYGLALLLVLVMAVAVVAWVAHLSQAGQRAPRFTVVPAQPAAHMAPPPSTEPRPTRQEP
ncbi:MAG: hypothetical protein AB7S86_08440 [Hydrogenophaga sp.]|uniref:hypothetical protein n=1 Tax=Hydrogenophaga sp. TaxID=1904254 RepID=UPI003D10FDBD